jgi:very-short-patch-repair endonuclease
MKKEYTWQCKICGLICKSRRKLQKHRAEEHPERLREPWNKGLTKATDERVAKNSLSVQETMKRKYKEGYKNFIMCKEYWTPERRKEQSERKKKLYSEHPEKHPNRKLANNRSKISYPERLAYDWLMENKITFIHQHKYKNRFVDFYLPERQLFIEIDGVYWHDEEADMLKDEEALKDGFKTLRIQANKRILETLTNNIL